MIAKVNKMYKDNGAIEKKRRINLLIFAKLSLISMVKRESIERAGILLMNILRREGFYRDSFNS